MGKTRVELDFSERALNRTDELATLTGASGRAEVVRRALQWYDFFFRLCEKDVTLYIERDGDVREIPSLSGVGMK